VLRDVVAAIGVLLVSLPFSGVLTLVLMPLWRWIEARYGIESVGHSGPAEWCFVVTFVACVMLTGGVYVGGVRGARTTKGA
jgi:hypothetical protein